MIVFLFILAFVWVAFAVVQDLKTREIANWLNFSLIIFALAVRMFYSVFADDYSFILFGIFGLGCGILLGNLFYYLRIFAGGDAKLLIALFVVIPVALTFYENLIIFLIFVLALLFFGGIYSLIYSVGLSVFNWRLFSKEFKKQFVRRKIYFWVSLIFSLGFLILSFFTDLVFLFLGVSIFVLPYLYVYLKSVEVSALVRRVGVDVLTEGDWLVSKIKLGRRVVNPGWEGLSKNDLEFLQKNYKKKVVVKYGVPFSPAFLFALLAIVLFLWNSFWGFW
ncbi:MAG: prepilin peptidase [Nanoarchaeota archaeon]|nr:prepilin peptidase [Nanoarchaeota archaeon]